MDQAPGPLRSTTHSHESPPCNEKATEPRCPSACSGGRKFRTQLAPAAASHRFQCGNSRSRTHGVRPFPLCLRPHPEQPVLVQSIFVEKQSGERVFSSHDFPLFVLKLQRMNRASEYNLDRAADILSFW